MTGRRQTKEETQILISQPLCTDKLELPSHKFFLKFLFFHVSISRLTIRSREYLRQTFPEHYPVSSQPSKKSGARTPGHLPTSGAGTGDVGSQGDVGRSACLDGGGGEEDDDDGADENRVRLEDRQESEERVSGCACS